MLGTESRNPRTTHISEMTTDEIMRVIQDENYNAVRALDPVLPDIARAADAVCNAIKNGGRLFYTGAGTSGRMGVLDAVECPPTYGVPRELIVGLIAGGNDCMFASREGVEDDGKMGIEDLKAKNLCDKDIVVGISAAGNAAYIADGLVYAKSIGCVTVGVTCNEKNRINDIADIKIVTLTGAEVITGSTRMKAGTAQKLVTNMISTAAMVKLGNVYENLMINLKPFNIKLRGRMIRIVSEITGADEIVSEEYLSRADFNIRAAVDLYKKENQSADKTI